ncbi:MAG: hypothetical protein AABO41_13465 [Acidobacteriota bacterium]
MNPAHLHIILNHIPVIGIPFCAALLIYGLLRKSDEVKRASLWAFVIIAVLTIPTFLAGQAAEDVVEHLPGVSEQLIENHERAALIGLIATLILGAGSLAALFLSRRFASVARLLTILLLVLSLMSGAWLARIANLGGKIRHTELRGDATSATDLEEAEEERKDEGGRGRNRRGRDK